MLRNKLIGQEQQRHIPVHRYLPVIITEKSMASANKEDQVGATPTVDAGQARALLGSGGLDHAYLDVRLPEDFDTDHAAGAHNVPYFLTITPQGQPSS